MQPQNKRETWSNRAILPVLLLFLVAVGFYGETTLRNDLDGLIYSRRQMTAELTARVVYERVSHGLNIALVQAAQPTSAQLVIDGKWQAAIDFISAGIPKDLAVDQVFLARPDGTIMAASPVSDAVGKSGAQHDWYQGVAKQWQPYVSDVFKPEQVPQYNVVAFAAPVKAHDGTPAGILVIQVRADTFLSWAEQANTGLDTFTYIVDRRGQVIVHPRYISQGPIIDFSRVPVVQQLLRGESGAEISSNPVDQGQYLVGYHPVQQFGWGVVVAQGTVAAFADRDRDSSVFVLVLGTLSLLLFGFLWYALRGQSVIERQRAREALYLDSVGDGIFVIDRTFRIVAFNKAAGQLSGWAKEAAIGRPMREVFRFLDENSQKEDIVFIEEAMLYGEPRQTESKTILVQKDDVQIPIGNKAAPVFNERGVVDGCVVVIRDLSAERAHLRVRSEFAYASHQLRTPVTKALWSLELALEDPTTAKEKVRTAYVSVQSVQKVTTQLIDVSELDQGMLQVRSEPFILRAMVAGVLVLLKSAMENRDISVSVEGIPEGLKILGDKHLLERMFFEVIDNAIQYNHRGDKVLVSANVEKDGVVITVEDHGIGILPEQQALVFTKFFRGSNYDTTENVGAGLGLYISREYATVLKGKIWFRSQSGVGSIFYISLPPAA